MYRLLLVSPDKDALSALASTLSTHSDVQISRAESGAMALTMISNAPVDLVVTDEKLGDMTGLDLALKMLSVNPMINCAAASSLSHNAFHEASEGLGLMAQLPLQPGAEHAEGLLNRLKEVKSLAAGVMSGLKKDPG